MSTNPSFASLTGKTGVSSVKLRSFDNSKIFGILVSDNGSEPAADGLTRKTTDKKKGAVYEVQF